MGPAQRQKNTSNSNPISMLDRPRKRIWPSLMRSALLNTSRHVVGLKNGNKPSNTSTSATAPTSTSTMASRRRAISAAVRRRAARACGVPRIALKNSLDGSTTITSERLRKLAR